MSSPCSDISEDKERIIRPRLKTFEIITTTTDSNDEKSKLYEDILSLRKDDISLCLDDTGDDTISSQSRARFMSA